MGFSGHLVFARSSRPLRESPVFEGAEDAVGPEERRPGGWRTVQLRQGAWNVERLPALVDRTGHPACVADVSDSDLALVTGLDTTGRRWQAWLNLDAVARLLVEEPDDVEDQITWLYTPAFHEAVRRKRAELDEAVPEDAEGALAWAAAAGAHPPAERAAIEKVLRSQKPFAEDLFSTLLDTLGFPGPTTA
ncbi:hypothetical protein ACWEGS_05260 [Streptomyces sp. NPDC004822]|uniref:hypothetical protein n=1 Tax=Streptomyces sp. NPDC057412 TaxID=3346123 RepID=UPI003683B2B6